MPELSTTTLFSDSSLQAYYRFNTGELTTDSKGSNTLTNVNTVGEATGKFGIGADFGTANSDKYLHIASNLGMNLASDYSVSLWVKCRTEPASGEFQFFF